MIARTPATMPNQLLFPVMAKISLPNSTAQNLPGKYPAKEYAHSNDDQASNPELHLRAGLNS
jgi:hypothetical protein